MRIPEEVSGVYASEDPFESDVELYSGDEEMLKAQFYATRNSAAADRYSCHNRSQGGMVPQRQAATCGHQQFDGGEAYFGLYSVSF